MRLMMVIKFVFGGVAGERERDPIQKNNSNFKHISLSYKPFLKQSLFQVRMYSNPWRWVSDDKQQRGSPYQFVI